jgi:hypothetical protein
MQSGFYFAQRKRVISWLISVIASACSQTEQSAGGQDLGVFIQCFEVVVVIFLKYMSSLAQLN